MPRTSNAKQFNLELPADLVEDFKSRIDTKKTTMTAEIIRFMEKFCGRKPSNLSRKRGRPKKVEESE